MSRFAAVLLAAAGSLAFLDAPAQAITNGQTETFSGGPANWWGLSSFEVLGDGGPAGGGDAYLHNYSTSPGGWLAVNNIQQWAGNYTAAGVTAVEADLINQGSVELQVRAFVHGSGGAFSSTIPFLLPADGQWHHVTFGVTPAELTWGPGSGAGDVYSTLQRVGLFSLRHQVLFTDGNGTQTTGSWGIDNVRATPEPASLISLLLLGVLMLSRKI